LLEIRKRRYKNTTGNMVNKVEEELQNFERISDTSKTKTPQEHGNSGNSLQGTKKVLPTSENLLQADGLNFNLPSSYELKSNVQSSNTHVHKKKNGSKSKKVKNIEKETNSNKKSSKKSEPRTSHDHNYPRNSLTPADLSKLKDGIFLQKDSLELKLPVASNSKSEMHSNATYELRGNENVW